MKSFLAVVLLCTAVIGDAAFAQSTQPSDRAAPAATAQPSDAMVALKGNWRASKLMGLNVYNEANEKLGDINELIVDKSGRIDAAVIGIGGFLGMGEHDILVEPSKIKFVNEARRTQTSANNPPANTTNPPATTRTSDATSTAPRAATEQWYPDHALLNATKDQLKAMPQFKYSSYN
jgi:sporulation protein YlmC with PRC-barrel domain